MVLPKHAVVHICRKKWIAAETTAIRTEVSRGADPRAAKGVTQGWTGCRTALLLSRRPVVLCVSLVSSL